MKTGSAALVVITLLAALAIGFLFLSDTVLHLGFGIIRNTAVTTSEAALGQVRDVLRLNTVEIVRKIVFPYDYVPADLNWDDYLKNLEAEPPKPEEEGYLDTFRVCQQIGINLKSKRREFVVITAIVKAGFDLSNTDFGRWAPAVEAPDRYAHADGAGGVSIFLPPAVITDIIIEDADTGSYPYPDIKIGPEDWKTLTSFVRAKIENETSASGVLDLARENGKKFLRRMLTDSGYSSVSFSE